MKEVNIVGIQQLGVGVKNLREAWGWYKKYFGIDIRILEEKAPSEYMAYYTGGIVRNRHAAIAISLQGGGGFEIWNHTDFEPRSAVFDVQLGDLGICVGKIKCKDPDKAYEWFKEQGQNLPGKVESVEGRKQFFIKDPYGNVFQLVPSQTWLREEGKHTGATYGAILGCSDAERSLAFYRDILGYDKVVYDLQGHFADLACLPGGQGQFRRILLTHSEKRSGPLSAIFGESEIELLQPLDRTPRKIFEDRFWGELGFIHLCFDIRGMDAMRERCKQNGYPMTVDTAQIMKDKSFDMGDAAGFFAYNEDPDGTLIEYVETHKIPVVKKLGIYINLQKRNPRKPLPTWMLKAMRFLKAKDI